MVVVAAAETRLLELERRFDVQVEEVQENMAMRIKDKIGGASRWMAPASPEHSCRVPLTLPMNCSDRWMERQKSALEIATTDLSTLVY